MPFHVRKKPKKKAKKKRTQDVNFARGTLNKQFDDPAISQKSRDLLQRVLGKRRKK